MCVGCRVDRCLLLVLHVYIIIKNAFKTSNFHCLNGVPPTCFHLLMPHLKISILLLLGLRSFANYHGQFYFERKMSFSWKYVRISCILKYWCNFIDIKSLPMCKFEVLIPVGFGVEMKWLAALDLLAAQVFYRLSVLNLLKSWCQ